MDRTRAGWGLFFGGYIILLIADSTLGISFAVFQAIIYALMASAVFLVYQGSRGKGGTGLRVLLTVTQFWLGYALAALITLVFSLIPE